MPTPTKPSTPFEIAREALSHVGRFKTPPTPSVYEVWYRYVEGVDDIIANLSHAVEDVNAVSVDLLEQLHQQYCSTLDETSSNTTETLTHEIESLQSLIDSQIQAGAKFGSDIGEACGTLKEEDLSATAIASVAQKLLVSNNAMMDQIDALQQQLQASQTKVRYLQDELLASQQATLTDSLTGLGNRRHFDMNVRRSLVAARANPALRYLLLIDLDRFKNINDTFGHACGDKVICYVAEQLRRSCPHMPISRLGGDEFAIILEVKGYAEATEMADQIRRHFSSTPLKLSETGEDLGHLELSIGGACLRADDDASAWFVRADKLLYEAKNGGRNSALIEHARAV